MADFNSEERFRIVEHIGVVTKHKTGWAKELNIVSWNGGPPKWDIRDWSENHCFMSRGITLTENEMEQLMALMLERKKKKKPLQTRIAEASKLHNTHSPHKENEEIGER